MHLFRSSSLLARLILAWFVLTLGVTVASPIIHPKSLDLVCTAGGATKLVQTSDADDEGGSVGMSHHTLDCPACLHLLTPPLGYQPFSDRQQPLAHALQIAFAAMLAERVGAPLPPRGPPLLAF